MKVTAGTPPCCVVCVAAEVVKWYLPIIYMCSKLVSWYIDELVSKLAKGEVHGGDARTCRRYPAREDGRSFAPP